MHKRTLGNSSLEISEVGLGTWQLGGDFGEVTEETAFTILGDAVKRGINFFDTADVYGGGKSEQIIGKFLKTTEADIIVVSKFGRREGAYPDSYSLEVMRSQIQDTLNNLGLKSIDLIQLHCIPTDELKKGDVFNWLRTLKSEGLIKNFGASVETMEEAKICMAEEGLTSLQIIFNLFRQNPITSIFDEAKEKGIGIIVRLPLASWMLAGKFKKETVFAEGDHRNYNKDGKFFSVGETFSGVEYNKGLDLVEKIRPIVPEGLTMSQFALRWILDHDAVTTIIAGASKPYQVDSNTSVTSLPQLKESVHTFMSELYTNEIESEIRGNY